MDSFNSPAPGAPSPFQSPPPIIVPPPPSAPRKNRAWMIISIVLFLLLGLSLLANFGQMLEGLAHLGGASPQRSGGPRLDEIVLEDNGGSEKIAVVPLQGVISGDTGGRSYSLVDVVKAQLDRAENDRRVKAVVLKLDSPGGEVLASDEIARAISEFQDSSKKPVIVSMGSLAASGGYYVAAPCRWIVANEMTITGSIGVIMSGLNYRGLMDKVGLRPEVFKSGRFKDMLRGSKTPEEISPEERAMVQKLIDETYAKFKSVIAEGRNAAHEQNDETKALSANWAEYADGRILSGKEAYELGFVDQLGSFDDAVAKAEELGKVLESANVIEYRQRNDFAELFGLFAQSESRGLKVDLGLDLPKLQAGRMYFLSPLFLH